MKVRGIEKPLGLSRNTVVVGEPVAGLKQFRTHTKRKQSIRTIQIQKGIKKKKKGLYKIKKETKLKKEHKKKKEKKLV